MLKLIRVCSPITVNDDIEIRPDRCRCQPEVDEDPDPKESDCKEVVIKSTSKYINAKSATAIDPSAGYNIASAGRYQQRSLTKVEKLMLVTIEFGDVKGRSIQISILLGLHVFENTLTDEQHEDRVRFSETFERLKELHRLNRRRGGRQETCLEV